MSEMSSSDYQRYVQSFPNARVLCVGDVMVDHFIQGTVHSELSTEAPVPVLRFQSKLSVLGGAANVLSNLAHLRSKSHLISVVGNNDSGYEIISKLFAELPGNPVLTLIKDESRRTTEVTRYICQKHHFLRLDENDLHPLSTELENLLISSVQNAFSSVDIIIFSDYGKGVLTFRVLQTLLPEAKAAGKLTLVDPRGKSIAKYSGTYMLKPNRFELAAITDLSTDSQEKIILAGREVMSKYNFDAILVTKDVLGMTLMNSGDTNLFEEPSHAQIVVDDVGAGDTVIATMGISLSLKIPFQICLHLASRAAALAIAKIGTSPISQQELEDSFDENKNKSGVVLTLTKAMDVMKKWREQNLRVAFTNGCFDLMHAGHFASLSKGKLGCDKLIIGLNSDASVRRLKGNKRPIQTQEIRAAALCALGIVDFVIIFEEDRPTDLLERLKPDVLFKSLPRDKIVGAEFVESYGGTVISVPLIPGFSTTATLARVDAKAKESINL